MTPEKQKEFKIALERVGRDFIEAIMQFEEDGTHLDPETVTNTPKRFAGYWTELLQGMFISNEDIAKKFNKSFEAPTDDLVVVKDIPFFSHCSHHTALMYEGKVTIGYVPRQKVLGLSKFARIVDLASKRLTIQEKLGKDILDIVMRACETEDVIVSVSAKHACMTARGAKADSLTKTTTLNGRFKTVPELRKEFYDLCR